MRRINLLNNNGGTLTWAIVVIFVLVILIGASLTMSFAYYNRSLINIDKRQAYLTSRSVVDALSDEIKNQTDSGNEILTKLNSTEDIIYIENIDFTYATKKQADISASIELEGEETIIITATTTIATVSDTVTMRLKQGSGYENPISEEFPGVTVPEEAITVTEEHTISGYIIADVYAKEGTVSFLNNADYYGNLYVEAGAVIEINQGSKANGNIYAASGSIFNFDKLHNFFVSTIFVRPGSVIKVNGIDYTIYPDGSGISVSPPGLDSDFISAVKIYVSGSGDDDISDNDDGWGGVVYE